ncbi:NTP transferase domain-containing protein, partial [Conexibacter stalactiti]
SAAGGDAAGDGAAGGSARPASLSPAARATYDGRPGHPVLLRRQLFAAVAELRGDSGARELLATVAVEPIPCDGPPPRDVDTPADLRGL